ncbi:unnamed protein product [Adineta ricciae]|uniref:Uncharacterized protein n=1 Tax=Adineta ricciae TaxID=249248 RepID=A0A814N2W7_ADIRI|nr:unnamed protein product [Adineta ricciae]
MPASETGELRIIANPRQSYLKCHMESSMAKGKSTSTPMTCNDVTTKKKNSPYIKSMRFSALVSSGERKPREIDIRTTVYKKKDFIYQLRMKSSRAFLSEVEKRFTLMPFTLRHFEDEKRARMGVIECAKHDLVEPYPVYQEKEGEFVLGLKLTVLLMPSGQMKITGLPIDLDLYESEYKVTDSDIKQLLTSSTQKKKKKGTGNSGTGGNAIEMMDAVEDDGKEDFEDEPEQPVKKTASQKAIPAKSES